MKKYAFIWLCVAFLLTLPPFFDAVAHYHDAFAFFRYWNLAAMNVVISLLLMAITLLVERFSEKLADGFLWTGYTIVLLVSFGETFMVRYFGLRYDPLIFQLLEETNREESWEFVLGYCKSFKFFVILFFYFIICGPGVFLFHKLRVFEKFGRYIEYGLIGVVLFSFVITLPEIFGCTIAKGREFPVGMDCFTCLHKAHTSYLDKKRECVINDEMHRVIQVDSCSYKSRKIILFIGESYNRHHSSLYGYPLSTSPCVAGLDSVFVFSDVVSTINSTSGALHYIFSMTSVDEDKSWSESPLFMSFFKKCGYHTTFYSNQFADGFQDNKYNFEGNYFLAQPQTSRACFSYRNTHICEYDGDMLDQYELDRDKIDVGDNILSIIHFMGQHMRPEDRYPQEYAYFNADSINRPDLTDKQRQEVAYYDNATRYNDSLVKRVIDMYKSDDVIFIYLADHSEEVYDFRDFRGRSFDYEIGADLLRYQLDIPFWIYATPTYRNNHPEIMDGIRSSVDKPFMTDDLPHLLLELAGINTPWFNPERSLINPLYNMNRVRLVGKENEKIDYDKVCNVKNQ